MLGETWNFIGGGFFTLDKIAVVVVIAVLYIVIASKLRKRRKL